MSNLTIEVWKKAQDSFSMQPDSSKQAKVRLAAASKKLGDFKFAYEILTDVREFPPALFLRALLLLDLNKIEDAKKIFLQLLECTYAKYRKKVSEQLALLTLE